MQNKTLLVKRSKVEKAQSTNYRKSQSFQLTFFCQNHIFCLMKKQKNFEPLSEAPKSFCGKISSKMKKKTNNFLGSLIHTESHNKKLNFSIMTSFSIIFTKQVWNSNASTHSIGLRNKNFWMKSSGYNGLKSLFNKCLQFQNLIFNSTTQSPLNINRTTFILKLSRKKQA